MERNTETQPIGKLINISPDGNGSKEGNPENAGFADNSGEVKRIRFDTTPEIAYHALSGWYAVHVEARYGDFQNDVYVRQQIETVVNLMTKKVPPLGLIFCGVTGNGKTTMARALYSLFRIMNREGFFGYMGPEFKFGIQGKTATEICELARGEKDTVLNRLKTIPILIIDDLGEEPMEVMVFGTPKYPIREIIEARDKNQVFTVITTNLTANDLPDRYGWRVVDRFKKEYKQIPFKRKSYRAY